MNRIRKKDIIEKANSKISNGRKAKAIVAFVDLLGFSSELLKNWENNSNEFLQRVMRIKSFIELCKEKIGKHTFRDYDEVTMLDTSEFPTLITFSDSFIFIKEIDESSSQTKMTSILSVVASIQELWGYSIEEGFTVRGAIDYGDFFYSEKDILGPAFISTYRMESKLAINSRILCSENITKLIEGNILQAHPTFKSYFQLWFKRDSDQKLILNPCIAFGIDNDEELKEATKRVEKMQFDADGDKVKSKYEDLIESLGKAKLEYSDMEIFKTQ